MRFVSFTQNVQALQFSLNIQLMGDSVRPLRNFLFELPASMLRPFTDLTSAPFVSSLLLNADALEKALKIMKVDSRALLGREIRASRLLEAPRVEPVSRHMVLEETLHTRPSMLLIRLLGDYGDATLWVRRADGRRQKCTTSLVALLALALRKDEGVTFEAEGKGALEMLDRLDKINAGGWRRWETTDSVFAPSTGDLTLAGIVACVEKAMKRFGVDDLCGVLHPESRRLYLGRPEWGHAGTALTADLKHVSDYGRVNFTKTCEGEIRAYFPEDVPLENIGGYLMLKKILGPILRVLNQTPR